MVSVSPDYDEGFAVLIALTMVGSYCCYVMIDNIILTL